MTKTRAWQGLAALPGLTIGQTFAAPIEGETASNAAAILILLGVWALLMSLRSLRHIRHRRIAPAMRRKAERSADLESNA
jgi:putative Mn2+ efflux pump MntP